MAAAWLSSRRPVSDQPSSSPCPIRVWAGVNQRLGPQPQEPRLEHAMQEVPYVLLVEDNPGDARLTQALLEEGNDAPSALRWVQSVEAAVQTLETERGCTAVLLDLGLPDSQGMSTLQAIRPYAQSCPIVVLTGEDSETVGLSAVVDGAQDFLVKGSFDGGLLRRSLSFAAHRKRAEHALLQRALHDELTGLPKRELLLDRLQEALKRAERGKTEGALLFIDLDRFKQINDNHGHAAGDAVLVEVSRRLSTALRGSDTAARLGGDEFVVLLPTVAAPQDALAVGRKLLEHLVRPLPYNGHALPISASIGVAGFRGSDESAQALMARADAAMYAAKEAGRGAVRLL
jgi:diguanylate cyclase (GGDEF)-like protein